MITDTAKAIEATKQLVAAVPFLGGSSSESDYREAMELVDYLIGEEMLATGDRKSLHRFYQELLNKDWFMTLLDTREYIACKEQMLKDYENRKLWGRKMLHNIACSSFFSSKRTIEDYDRDIWNLG